MVPLYFFKKLNLTLYVIQKSYEFKSILRMLPICRSYISGEFYQPEGEPAIYLNSKDVAC